LAPVFIQNHVIQCTLTYTGTNTIKSNEEPPLVDKRFEISKLDLVKGLKEMVYFIDVTDTQFDLYTPRV
jgi:hypothetical protein